MFLLRQQVLFPLSAYHCKLLCHRFWLVVLSRSFFFLLPNSRRETSEFWVVLKCKWSSVLQWIKDPAWSLQWLGSLLWLRFNPWPRNFHMLCLAKKKKKKTNRYFHYEEPYHLKYSDIIFRYHEPLFRKSHFRTINNPKVLRLPISLQGDVRAHIS